FKAGKSFHDRLINAFAVQFSKSIFYSQSLVGDLFILTPFTSRLQVFFKPRLTTQRRQQLIYQSTRQKSRLF
ncbi:hypothetical protein, partial [Brevibacillus sp. AY1]|uniref:hypothetical protein n=1 Tax=Brevibacillus sp. AY1 TaxID=2807621 RepID=UPI0024552FD4